MKVNLPHDDDGDAIRRLENDGANLSRQMTVDFQLVVPTKAAAEKLEEYCASLGYATRLNDEGDQWLVECTIEMLVTYEEIVAKQADLAAAARPFGGKVDGWGSCGN